jgi:hypothetical protein
MENPASSYAQPIRPKQFSVTVIKSYLLILQTVACPL